MMFDSELKVMGALESPTNWSPNLTKISKQTGIAISTVYNIIERLNKSKYIIIKPFIDFKYEGKEQ